MQTLTYGFQLPQAGDKGPVLFPALEQNIQRLNDHTHDGVDSALIPGNNIESSKVEILAAGWTSFGGNVGEYRQLVQMAGGYEFDTTSLSFRTSSGEYVYPKIVRNDNISYYIYCNDPTVNLMAIHGG